MRKKTQAEDCYKGFLTALFIDKNISKALSFFTDNVSGINASATDVISGKAAFELVFKNLLVKMQAITGYFVRRFYFSEIDENNCGLMTVLELKKGADIESEDIFLLKQSVSLHRENNRYKIAMLCSDLTATVEKRRELSQSDIENWSIYKAAWEHYGSPVTIMDINRNILYLNEQSRAMLQKPVEEYIGKPCMEVWHYDICGTRRCGIECLERGLKLTSYDEGNKRVKIETSFLKGLDGTAVGYIEIGSDVTEIAELTEKFDSMSANIPGGICQIRLDLYCSLLYGNDAFYELLGCTKEKMQREYHNRLFGYLTTKNYACIAEEFLEAQRLNQTEISFETSLLRPDNIEIWILLRATLVKNKTVANIVIIDITERKTMEKELQLSQERLRGTLERNFTNVFDYDFVTKRIMQPDSIAELYGMSRLMENVPESILESGVICEESVDDFKQLYAEILSGKPTATKMIKTFTKEGQIRYNKFSMSGILDESGHAVRAIGLIEDITQQQEMKMAFLQEQQYRTAMLLDVLLYFEMNLSQDTYYKCKGSWNFEFVGETRFRYSALYRQTLLHSITEEFQEEYKKMFSIENAINDYNNGIYQLSLEYKRFMNDGQAIWVSSTMNMVKDLINGDIKGFMYMKDIDLRKKAELMLKHASSHDSLTGLLNKACTEAIVKETLEKDDAKQHAFLILDIDHFKSINDNYGHYIGDCVLTEVANSLSLLLREQDILGRIGGDEFVMFLRDIPNTMYVSVLADNICKNFWAALSNKEGFPVISCSIGISLSSYDGYTFYELYQKADAALYEAKKLGRKQFVQYNLTHNTKKPYANEIDDDIND